VSNPTFPIEGQGGCCPCSDLDGCQCNEGSNCLLNCQSRTSPTGTASFCGFAEYIPSDPPGYYLSKHFDGTVLALCGDPVCDGSNTCTQTYSYSGSNTIDKNTCVETQGAQFSSVGCCNNLPVFVEDVSGPAIAGVACGHDVEYGYIEQTTPTQHLVGAANGCTPNATGTGACAGTGTAECHLGDEETPDDAIARAVAAQPWGGAPAYDCTKNFSSTTAPLPGQRVFAFRQAEFRVAIGEPIPGHIYQAVVTLGEHAVGTDAPLVPFEQITVEVQADLTGHAVSDWISIPNVLGLVIYPYKCTYTDLSA